MFRISGLGMRPNSAQSPDLMPQQPQDLSLQTLPNLRPFKPKDPEPNTTGTKLDIPEKPTPNMALNLGAWNSKPQPCSLFVGVKE